MPEVLGWPQRSRRGHIHEVLGRPLHSRRGHIAGVLGWPLCIYLRFWIGLFVHILLTFWVHLFVHIYIPEVLDWPLRSRRGHICTGPWVLG